jgi:NAD(P)H-binding
LACTIQHQQVVQEFQVAQFFHIPARGMPTSPSPERTSILLIGASSRTGLECIQQLAEHDSNPFVHAFCEGVEDLDPEFAAACTSVVEGSIRHAIDIQDALEVTKASWIVLCGDSSEDSSEFLSSSSPRQKNLRTVSARNIARVLQDRPSIRVLVVSRIEAPGLLHNTIKMNLRARLCQLRHLQFLHDLAGQEQALVSIWNRTTVVRTTLLTDRSSGSKRIIELNDNDTIPTLTTDRIELAKRIVAEICTRPIPTGNRVLSVTSAKC